MTLESLDRLFSCMADLGATYILIKSLARNDNSKNQVYLGPSYDALRELPSEGFKESDDTSKKIQERKVHLNAPLQFFWIDGEYCSPAPEAKLILYPQYPEVRMSGFLKGCDKAPSNLMGHASRITGRILFLGIAEKKIFAHVTSSDSSLGREAREWLDREGNGEITGVFRKVVLSCTGDVSYENHRDALLRKLTEICQKGWIPSCRLQPDGTCIPYKAQNGAGYTLEAACGILPNGFALPDYLGWELKATVTTTRLWPRINPSAHITLMTPEPTLGLYSSDIDLFRERYSKIGRKNPRNMYFTGRRHVGKEQNDLVMLLEGVKDGKINDASACIILFDKKREEIAAGWALTDILEHWRRKHNRTAYIPYEKNKNTSHYRYSNRICLGEGYDFSKLINAFSKGLIYHDPGVKFERGENGWKSHRRNQFRSKVMCILSLYSSLSENVELQ